LPAGLPATANGKVIMYCDAISDAMQLSPSKRRSGAERSRMAYNDEHHITPTTIIKPIQAAAAYGG
jgi:excinuclease ABC subunit B